MPCALLFLFPLKFNLKVPHRTRQHQAAVFLVFERKYENFTRREMQKTSHNI